MKSLALHLHLQSLCTTVRGEVYTPGPVRSTASKEIPVSAYAGMAVGPVFLDSLANDGTLFHLV